MNLSTTMTSPLDELKPTPEAITASAKDMNLLTLDNPVFGCYIFWASILLVKMCLMSILTAVQRVRKKAYLSKEDTTVANTEPVFDDPDVERARRAHLNDMENILPFLILSLIYVCVDPNPTVACILIRIASVARISHTLVYAFYPVPQPARGICFGVAFAITISIGCMVAVHSAKYI